MKYSEKELKEIVRKNLMEKAMDFDTPDRPHQSIQSKLASGDTPIKKVPLPRTGNINKNFQEVLASESYKKLIQKYRGLLGVNAPTLRGVSGPHEMGNLFSMMMDAHNKIVNIERQNREELEKLAVELVMREMGIEENEFIFDAKIVGMGEIDMSNFKRREDDDNPEEVDVDTEEDDEEEMDEENAEKEVDIFKKLENFNVERAKRRLINLIIQGRAKQSHDMYHLVNNEITQITGHPEILNLYSVLLTLNDINYWQFSNDTIESMASSSVAGKEHVEGVEDPDNPGEVKAKIVARGINFPVLVHELLKGVYEAYAINARPESGFEDVESAEDIIDHEMWDLRLGDALWNRIRMQLPDELVVDENKKRLQSILFQEIFKLPARKFLVLLKEVMSGSPTGRRLLTEFLQLIENLMNDVPEDDYQSNFRETLDSADDEIDDDDLYDALGELGIAPPEV